MITSHSAGVTLYRLPKFYGVKMQRKIDAGAGVEDLRARCPYFYDVAGKLHEISSSELLARFVNGCFRARYRVCHLTQNRHRGLVDQTVI